MGIVDIDAGEEKTIDYATTENDGINKFRWFKVMHNIYLLVDESKTYE